MRGGVGGALDERTSKTGRSEMHGVKSTSCPQVMNCCATAALGFGSYPLAAPLLSPRFTLRLGVNDGLSRYQYCTSTVQYTFFFLC